MFSLSRTGLYPELDDPDRLEGYKSVVDIVSDHFYPLSLDTLLQSAEAVSALEMPFIIGEIGWSKSGEMLDPYWSILIT